MPDLPSTTVDEACAWQAKALEQDRNWVYRLTEEELRELETAGMGTRERGLGATQFHREDFPLPRLTGRIEQMLEELEFGRGCIWLRGLPVQTWDEDTSRRIYWGIGTHLGTTVSQNAKGEVMSEVADQGRDYQADNVRGYTTRAELRPHCDAADLVTLLCMRQSSEGGESLIASAIAIYNETLKTHPEYLPHLARGFHFDLRGEGATGDPGEVTRHRVPVYSYFSGRLSCRYNQRTIEDGQRKSGEPLGGQTLDAVRYVGQLARDPRFCYPMEFEPGDMQVLNNHTILHSRRAFVDSGAERRRLLRLWLNTRVGRPLAPEFADRFNTGPRAGVATQGVDY